jgi:transposase InsO family protein
MPWEVVNAVDQRIRFIRLWQSEDCPSVASLCREFGISRKTAYFWIKRFENERESGLAERSHKAHHQANAISEEMEDLVVAARARHPSWGAKKLLPWLQGKHPGREDWPCVATVSAILARNHLVRKRRLKRPVAPFAGQASQAGMPNDRWCIDHKGWWFAQNGQKCEPFTVTDEVSRFLIRCAVGRSKAFSDVYPILADAFREYGLPRAIKSDNGPPFASRAPLGLSALTIWFMRLGIVHERIEAGKPQQNGRHERMHLTMMKDTGGGAAAGASLAHEQLRLNKWRQEFNNERPHEALEFATPRSRYVPSPRPMPRHLPELQYEAPMHVRKVDKAGKLYWRGRDVFATEALQGQLVGFEPVEDQDGVWTVWLGNMRLAHFDERKLQLRWEKAAVPREP